MKIQTTNSIIQSRPFHTFEAALTLAPGEIVGVNAAGTTLGGLDADGETSIPYGLVIESIDGVCLVCDYGWVFNDWALSEAECRILKTAGVIVQ